MKKNLNIILASLPPDKIKLLAKKMGAKVQPKNNHKKIGLGDVFMLSSSQQGMWMAMQMHNNSAAFNNPWAAVLTLTQPLDEVQFNKSISLLIEKHEALRTGFEIREGIPVQVVKEPKQIVVVFEDLRKLPEEKKIQICKETARDEGLKSFDLAHPPLFRIKVLRLQETVYLFLITSHHLISDGWSNLILTKEMYFNEVDSYSENLFQYSDYVDWENEWIKTEAFNQKLAFWKNELKDLPAPLELPLDKRRPTIGTYNGNMEEVELSKQLLNKVKLLCKQGNNTIFHFFLTVYNLLLFYYTGESDIIVGVPFANRVKKEVQQTLGLFMNALPLRTKISGDASFRLLMNKIKQTAQQIMAHQEIAFERILKELECPRVLGVHPIFQVMFVYQNIPEIAGVNIKRFKANYGLSKYDINLWLEESATGHSLTLTYNSDIFTPATAKKLLDQFIQLSYAVIESPDQVVQSLRFLDDEELSCSIGEHADFGRPQCFHHLFEAQAIKTPNITAVDDTFNSISYRELNGRANQVAEKLSESGLKKGDVAILLTSRSINFVIAFLGAMKCGISFLPVDEACPPERLKLVYERSNAAIILQEKALAHLAQHIPVQKTSIDALETPNEKYDVNPYFAVTVNDIAYTIYTSGTTGVPKGVCIAHRQLFNYVRAVSERMQINSEERFAWISSHAFDLGNTMIFPCLAAGGRLVLIQNALATNPADLSTYLKNNPVDYLKIVPSHLQAILHCDTPEYVLPNKLLVLGGEASSIEFIEVLKQLKPGCRIMNHYGPTETTVGVCTFEVPSNLSKGTGTLPIGSALPNNSLHIMKNGVHVPKGAIGEIYIGGAQLFSGYLNEPELTSKAYIPDPFDANAVLYKTGDRGMMLNDGSIVYLGRNDKQVKVRGHRVELNEIELVLGNHPYIDAATVVYKNNRLLAYFTHKKNSSETTKEEIILFLKDWLPIYMVPDILIPIDSIPINTNGKIDYQKLATYDPQPNKITLAATPTEEIISKIWQEVISMTDIQQDFFDAGGNSLLGMQLVHKVNNALNTNIDINHLFEHSTIQKLALFVQIHKEVEGDFNITLLKHGSSNIALVLIHPAGGNTLCYRELARHLNGKYPVYVIGSTAAQNISITDLAKKYLKKMLKLYQGKEFIFAGWSMGSYIAFEMGCLCAPLGVSTSVIIIDQPAPAYNIRNTSVSMDTAGQLDIFLRKVENFTSSYININLTDLRKRSTMERNELLLTQFKSLSLIPQNVSPEDFHVFLELLIMHNSAAINYQPTKYNDNVLLISGLDSNYSSDIDLEWQPHCKKKIKIEKTSGDHASILSQNNVGKVAVIIENWLKTNLIK